MSIVEMPGTQVDDFPPEDPGPTDVMSRLAERTPPQDVQAEVSVLGSMLLSKDAVADVIEILREDDFYKPAHQVVFASIRDMFAKGEPADAVTVANALSQDGELDRIGGAVYLHTLVSGVPTAANAAYYADIVRERATLRRLVTAATRITTMGYEGEGDVDQIVDRAQQEIFEVGSRKSAEDYLPLSEVMDGAVTEIEGIAARGGEMVGVPTGFIDMDRLTNGFHAGQLIIVAARPAIGKALAVDTPVATPQGWTTMGELQPGDAVFGSDGRPTAVQAATDVMTDHDCYRVECSDGASLVADAEHLWQVRLPGAVGVFTTRELAETAESDPGLSIELPRTAAIGGLASPLSQEPYAFGVHLSDPWAEPDPTTTSEISLYTGAGPQLRVAGTGSTIPREYLRAAETQRRALLADILDRAATVTSDGRVSLRCPTRQLLSGLYELLTTLALADEFEVVEEADAFRISFAADQQVFRIHAKQVAHKEASADRVWEARRITSITRVASVPVRCIQVAADDHLFLAGRSLVPTHNSTLGLDVARAASIENGLTSVIFSLEMSRNEIVMRLLSAEAQISLSNMRSGKMNDPEWRKIASRQGVLHEAPLFIDDSPNLTMTEIRAKCRRLKQRHDLKLVVVDYMQLMQSGKKVESRQQEVSEFSRSMKLLAKELDVPVIAISQLNRGPEARNDKKPMLSDLRESGCLTGDTRVLRADTGAEVTMGELYRTGAKDVPVWSLDDSLRYRARTMTHVFSTGHREVFEMRTASGRVVKATANHPMLTYDGWKPLGELDAGDRVAVSRHLPAALRNNTWDVDELTMLGALLSQGRLSQGRVSFTSEDQYLVGEVAGAAERFFGLDVVREDSECGSTTLKFVDAYSAGREDPLQTWLGDMDLLDVRPQDRRLPQDLFAATKQNLMGVVARLWMQTGCIKACRAGDGSCESATGVTLSYATNSRGLADDVVRVLPRIGVMAEVHQTQTAAGGRGFKVAVTDPADQEALLRYFQEQELTRSAADAAMDALISGDESTDAGTQPTAWDEVKDVISDAQADGTVDTLILERTPDRIVDVAAALDTAELDLWATNDVAWDDIVSVKSIGFQDVFDATVLGTHNFIADGVAVHNSLEQDADMVILIHREDAYDKDTDRVGEADLIVAKHRNGPTDTITVSFQGHYSRFVDMARE